MLVLPIPRMSHSLLSLSALGSRWGNMATWAECSLVTVTSLAPSLAPSSSLMSGKGDLVGEGSLLVSSSPM